MPIWIPLSILTPALSAAISIFDKYFVDRYSVYVYLFWIGAFEALWGSAFTGIANSGGLEIRTLWGGVFTGAVTDASLILLLAALRRGQVARVIPIWYLAPLMVAPMAAIFLDERLTTLSMIAIVMAVGGAVLVTWQKSERGGTFGDPVVFPLAVSGAAVMAVSFILIKYFLEEGGYWRFVGAFRLGIALPIVAVGLLPTVRRNAFAALREGRFLKPFIGLQLIVSWSFIVRFAAISTGPVSLVAAVSSLQPIFVFLFVYGLATMFPANFGDWITKRTISSQMAGILVISAAVAIISTQ